MTYTVIWRRRAKEELAKLWLSSVDRASFSLAADQIDEMLKRSPLDVGESRHENFRILCVLPLVVGYRVSEPDRLVTVGRVHAV